MVSIIILHYNLMGPPSYMRSVVGRNVVIRRMTVFTDVMCQSCKQVVFQTTYIPYL